MAWRDPARGAWGREKRRQEQRGPLERLTEEEGFERGVERPGGEGEPRRARLGQLRDESPRVRRTERFREREAETVK